MSIKLAEAFDSGTPGGMRGRVTARNTVGIEPWHDYRRPDVHWAVVERRNGRIVSVPTCDVDLLGSTTLEQSARRWAREYEADYVEWVTP